MKVIIDISEKMYEDCKVRNTGNYSPYDFSSMITNGTPITDNATNGEVMMALFKEVQYWSDGKICANWWNAPYRAYKRG